jgi:hypothetical protein
MTDANPYNYNLPVGPEMFFGRETDVKRLTDALTATPGDSVALIGGRRMGKTSLLEALLRTFETQAAAIPDRLSVVVFLDLSGEWLETVTGFFKLICTEVAFTLDEQLPDELQEETFVLKEGRPPAPAFRKLLEGWGREAMVQTGKRLRLMLLLDECEQTVEQPWASDLYSALRYLLVGRTTRTLLKVVMVGSHGFLTQVRQHGSPLRNVLKYHTLGVLNAAATRDLIVGPTGGTLSEEIVRTVIDQSGGHPFFTQYLMHHLWERGLEGATSETARQIAAQFPHERGDLHDWTQSIGATGASAYRVLVQEGRALTEAQIRADLEPAPLDLVQALDALCYYGLAQYDSNEETYRVGGEMFRRWFVDNLAPTVTVSRAQAVPPAGSQAAPIVVPAAHVAGDEPARDESVLDSLRRQLTQEQENLRLVEERKSQYVQEEDTPLQLIKNERHLLKRIAELEQQIEELEQSSDAE